MAPKRRAPVSSRVTQRDFPLGTGKKKKKKKKKKMVLTRGLSSMKRVGSLFLNNRSNGWRNRESTPTSSNPEALGVSRFSKEIAEYFRIEPFSIVLTFGLIPGTVLRSLGTFALAIVTPVKELSLLG